MQSLDWRGSWDCILWLSADSGDGAECKLVGLHRIDCVPGRTCRPLHACGTLEWQPKFPPWLNFMRSPLFWCQAGIRQLRDTILGLGAQCHKPITIHTLRINGGEAPSNTKYFREWLNLYKLCQIGLTRDDGVKRHSRSCMRMPPHFFATFSDLLLLIRIKRNTIVAA